MWFSFGFSSCNMDKPVFGFGVVLVLWSYISFRSKL